MGDNKNVSVTSIQDGITYLEDQFMKPLVKVGQDLIDEYTIANKSLKSDAIDKLIKEQQNKLDEIQRQLTDICNRAKSSMDDSSKVIAQNQDAIDETLANV